MRGEGAARTREQRGRGIDTLPRCLILVAQLAMRNLIAFLLLIGALSAARAQIISGTIVGTATDVSGSVVANAKITAMNESTGVLRSTDSDVSGGFVLPQLAPGNYKPSASAPGFSTYEVSHIVLL